MTTYRATLLSRFREVQGEFSQAEREAITDCISAMSEQLACATLAAADSDGKVIPWKLMAIGSSRFKKNT